MLSSLLTLLLLSAYCPIPHPAASTDSAETEALEAVFRHQINKCYKERSPQLYFLSYKENDPSDTLLNRLKDLGPSVRRRSQMSKFKDRDTGEDGILIAIGDITWKSEFAAKVRASCGVAPLDGYSYEYRIVKKNRKWMVKSHKLTGVS